MKVHHCCISIANVSYNVQSYFRFALITNSKPIYFTSGLIGL